MDTTLLLMKIIGPLLILRGLSVLFDMQHFRDMLEGLEEEIDTVSFSMVPVFLFLGFGALLITHWRFDSVPAALISLMALGGVIKSSFLILFPRLGLAKAKALGRAGFLHVVWVVCLMVGSYFTWIGWLA